MSPGLRALLADTGGEMVVITASSQVADMIVWQESDSAADRIAAFGAGADDIIGPWMDRAEALARLERARARRSLMDHAEKITAGELRIDRLDRTAFRCERPIGLLGREFDLLLHLVRARNRVQRHADLLRAVWRLNIDPGTNVVAVHMSRLRAKLDNGYAWPMLRTVRGIGYALVSAPDIDLPDGAATKCGASMARTSSPMTRRPSGPCATMTVSQVATHAPF